MSVIPSESYESRDPLNPVAIAACGQGQGSLAIGRPLLTPGHDARRASVRKRQAELPALSSRRGSLDYGALTALPFGHLRSG